MAKTITGKQVGDSYYQVEHPSGLTVLLYPKEHCSTTYAIFGTRYGSIDNCFQRSDEAGPESVPEALPTTWSTSSLKARKGTPSSASPKQGPAPTPSPPSSPPATCSPPRTRCTSPWRFLLDFVQSPYFTEETVRKEQGIIGQEIKMYDDDPQWRVMFNYLKAMYHSHPIRGGTLPAQWRASRKSRRSCCTGATTPSTTWGIWSLPSPATSRWTRPGLSATRCSSPLRLVTVQRVFPQELDTIVQPVVEERLSVASPLFRSALRSPGRTSPAARRTWQPRKCCWKPWLRTPRLCSGGCWTSAWSTSPSFSYEYFEGNGYAR